MAFKTLVPLVAAALAVFALSPAVDAAQFNPPKHYYLALGDSLAFGAQLGSFSLSFRPGAMTRRASTRATSTISLRRCAGLIRTSRRST